MKCVGFDKEAVVLVCAEQTFVRTYSDEVGLYGRFRRTLYKARDGVFENTVEFIFMFA
jgi:hypothetical protein